MRKFLFVLAACSSAKEQSPCDKQVDRLAKWSAQLVAEGSQRFVDMRGLEMASADVVGSQQPDLPILFVTEDLIFQGQMVDAETMVEDFRGLPELAVMVDAKVPWRRIETVRQAANAAGVKTLRFLVHGTTKVTKPPPSWIDHQLDELAKPADSSKRAARLGEPRPPVRQLFATCTTGRDLMMHLDEKAEETKREKTQVLVAELPAALRGCGCAEDINAVERWLWSTWGRDDPSMPQASIAIAPAQVVSISPDTPWATAVKQLH